MESHPKVMTVSYGTFSCTLEGFDDPFTTMQLVAEYFRKLASEDRYFGGEPLQPDHNKLHQIAKEANPYKVDAEVTDSGITLRKAEVVDVPAQNHSEKIATDGFEEQAMPFFTSNRKTATEVEEVSTSEVDSIESEEQSLQDASSASFVEVAIFSSRRGQLEAAESEPDRPASVLLREEEGDDEEADQIAVSVEAFAAKEALVEVNVEKDSFPETPSEIELDDVNETKAETAAEPKTALTNETKAQNEILREEEALERLLETTNNKLENPAHTRRSNALERLKAAVAATEAERQLRSGSPRTERPQVQDIKVSPSQFKDRLGEVRREHEEVVKMTRPVSKSNIKRARSSIATLILGSDQRVSSANAAEAAGPAKKPGADGANIARPALKIVRPEEVTQTTAEPKGFDAFAQKIGANTLHDLLEASAAYLAIVEDEPRFSQNRIISNLDSYLSENNITEDVASRSLNRLMRDGRILRVKQDSYTISKSAKHGIKDRMAG